MVLLNTFRVLVFSKDHNEYLNTANQYLLTSENTSQIKHHKMMVHCPYTGAPCWKSPTPEEGLVWYTCKEKDNVEMESAAIDGGEGIHHDKPLDVPPLVLHSQCCLERFLARFSWIWRGESHSDSAHTPSLSALAALLGRQLQNRPLRLGSHFLSWPEVTHLHLFHQLLWNVRWGRKSHIWIPDVLHCCYWGIGWQALIWEPEDGDRPSPGYYSRQAHPHKRLSV